MEDKITISQAVLEWISTAINITELPPKEQENFHSWLTRKSNPTFKEIETFSKKSRIPFGYFFMTAPPHEELSLIEHRTVNSVEFQNPSRDFIDTYNHMKLVQDWMIDYLEDIGEEDLSFVGKMHGETQVKKIADAVRKLLFLDSDKVLKTNDSVVFKRLRESISRTGVIVMQNGVVGNNTHRPLNVDEFRGFALVDNKAPLIFVNARDSANGKVFTLLHEFVHLCIGSSDLYNGSIRSDETIANAVASELILPNDLYMTIWKERVNHANSKKELVLNIAKEFRCGPMVVARRTLDNRLITNTEYREIEVLITRTGKQSQKRKGGGDYYSTVASRFDKQFLASLNESVQDGTTSYMEAFRLTNTTNRTFTTVVESALRGAA